MYSEWRKITRELVLKGLWASILRLGERARKKPILLFLSYFSFFWSSFLSFIFHFSALRRIFSILWDKKRIIWNIFRGLRNKSLNDNKFNKILVGRITRETIKMILVLAKEKEGMEICYLNSESRIEREIYH